MIRELADVAVDMSKQAAFEGVRERAEENVEEKLLDILLPPTQLRLSSRRRPTPVRANSRMSGPVKNCVSNSETAILTSGLSILIPRIGQTQRSTL